MAWPANKILLVLQDLKIPATVADLVAATGHTPKQIWNACHNLAKNKLITCVVYQLGAYLITPAGESAIAQGKKYLPGPRGEIKPPLRGRSFRSRFWRVLRMERKGTIGDFLGLILQDGEDASKLTRNTQQYLNGLCKAGYVIQLPGRSAGTAVTSNGYARYLLVIDNGPQAPMVRRATRSVYDPNTKQNVKFQEVTREQ